MTEGLSAADTALGVVKEVEDVADKALDLADKGLNLKDKFEIIEDDKQRRNVDATAHKVNVVMDCATHIEQAADGMIDLVSRAADEVAAHEEQARIRKIGRVEREVDAAVNIYTKVRPVVGDMATVIAPYFKKFTESRSEVQLGFCQGRKLAMFGSKACIVVDLKAGELIFLTSDTISSCSFAREKFHITKLKNFYYYEITFKNGQKSSIRMSKRYRDALEHYTTINHYDQEVETDSI